MRRWVQLASKAVFILYPFYVWWALQHWHPAVAMLPLLAVLAFSCIGKQQTLLANRWMYGLTLLLLALALGLGRAEQALLYYPAWINFGLLTVFAYSLLHPPSVVERLARLMEGDLDARAIAYTRQVTRAWCCFFLVNGSIAVGTVWWGNMDVWLLYNGCIAYVLMGLFFVIEWRVRQFVKATH